MDLDPRQLPGLSLTFCFLCCMMDLPVSPAQATTLPSESKMSSQCFREQGMSFVSLYCGFQRVIQVKRAFHGGHAKTADADCMYLEGDCTEDVMDMYDWVKCNDKHSCVQLMKRARVPTCGGGDGYLQVDYLCVPGSEKQSTTPAPVTTTIENAKETQTNTILKQQPQGYLLDICSNRTLAASGGLTVTSPDYPASLPGQMDCKCDILARKGSQIHAVVQHVSLGTHNGLCHDWLAIITPGYPDDQVILCGQMKNSGKAVLSKNNKLTMHFHSALGTHPASLKGFRLLLTENKHNDLKIRCYKATPIPNSSQGKVAMVLKPTDIKSLPFVSDLPKSDTKNMSSSLHSWTYLLVVTLGMCLNQLFHL